MMVEGSAGQETAEQGRGPALAQAVLCFAGNLLIISTGLFALDVSLHILLFLCLIWTALHLRWLGHHFLAAGLVLCSLMSVATGTAWGTVGTLGVVLMGLAEAMGVPLAHHCSGTSVSSRWISCWGVAACSA